MQRVTIATLAEKLGVSKASVSYALNGQPGVSEQTRQRVVALANELGWHPSSSARALSRQRADAIGMVLRRDPALLGTEPYYMRLLEGVESALSEAGQSLLLRMVGTAPGRDIAVYERWAAERRVDGVIVLDRSADDTRPEQLQRLGLPFVLHGVLPADDATGQAGERIENQHRDAEMLVAHLAELGHTSIAHVTGPMHLSHELDRMAAVRRESAEHGMTAVFAEADYTFDTAHVQAAQLLAASARPTAIICSNDVMALGTLRALDEAGLSNSVALLSWDDSMLCQFASPSISALERFPDRQGRRSAQMLLELLDGKPFSSIEPSPSELRVRESSRRAA